MAYGVSEDELVGLALAIVFCVVALILHARLSGREWWPLLGAFLLTIFGRLMTVLEGVAYYDLCNLLEHASGAGAAICLAVYCWRLRRPSHPPARSEISS